MVSRARRRDDQLAVAQARASERRSTLERHERFMHDAPHELRTPVTIARAHLELLLANDSDAELDIALDEVARIDAIIDQLLLLATADQPDFLRIENVEGESSRGDVFMRWSEVAPWASRFGPLAPATVAVDRISCARRLTRSSRMRSSTRAGTTRSVGDGSGELVIEAEDEGLGVGENALARIFDRFTRAESARARSGGGLGLTSPTRSQGPRRQLRGSEHGARVNLRAAAACARRRR
jgi:two-component system, OmpR family, sensor kinase